MAASSAASGGRQLAWRQDARERFPEAFAQGDHVVHRHATTAIHGRGPFGVLMGEVGPAGLDGHGDAFGEQLGIPEQLAEAGLVEATLDRRVGVHRDAQRARRKARLVRPDPRGGVGQPGGRVGRRQAQTWVAHDGWSLAWTIGARHAGRGYDDCVTDPDQEHGEPPATTPSSAIPPAAEPVTPGERRLAHPPSDRYRLAETPPADERPDPGASVVRGVAIAVAAAGLGAVAIVILGGVLTVTAGLVIVAAGHRLGRRCRASVRRRAPPAGAPSGGHRRSSSPSCRSRSGRPGCGSTGGREGGVLAPLDYLAEVYGPLVPLQIVAAAVAAWVGAR